MKLKTLLKWYLKDRAGLFAAAALFWLIFSVVFCLYTESFEPLGYSWLLCLYFAVILTGADFWRYRKRCLKLQSWCWCAAASSEAEELPQRIEDVIYRECIRSIQTARAEESGRYREQALEDREYFTVWCHQIKTPIAAMRLMLQGEDSPLARQLSEEVRSVEQYASMVLAFVRLDSDTTDYVFREQALDPIVREAVKKFAGQFIRKKLRLTYEPIRARVLTDEKWLCFVIEQILSNAVKYTNEGGVAITWQEPDTLVIRDTGIGIAPEDLPRVFEKSYTGYNGRSDKKSSGIGLYLCRRICTRLGHRIGVSSEPGRGTAVWISLSHEELHLE